MKRECLIDTSTLVNLFSVDPGLLSQLLVFFSHVYIPLTVKSEFEKHAKYDPRRQAFLSNLRVDSGNIRICTTKELLLWTELQRIDNVDEGEADLISQAPTRSISCLLIDDFRAIASINANSSLLANYTVISSAAIMAMIELTGRSDADTYWKRYFHVCPISFEHWSSSYIQASVLLGLNVRLRRRTMRRYLSLQP